MILAVVFYTAEDTAVVDGKTYNFWAGGHMVYMNCVILANFIILKMQHAFHVFNFVIIAGQIISFFVLLWYFQFALTTDPLYKFMDEFIASPTAWLGSLFCVTSFWTIDEMLKALRIYYGTFFAADDEKSKKKQLTEDEVRRPSHVYSSASRSVSAIRHQID